MKRFLLVFTILVLGAFIFAMFYYDESPQAVCQRFARLLREATYPTPAPAPRVAEATPAPTPTPTPPVVPRLTPAPAPVATPKPDPIAWLLAHPDRQPKEVALLEAIDFQVVFNGAIVGSVKVPLGTKVGVARIDADGVDVVFQGSRKRLPYKATNLLELAQLAMAAPEPAPAPEIVRVPNPEAPAPTPFSGFENHVDVSQRGARAGFVHPGLLSTEADFERMRTKVRQGAKPWAAAYKALTSDWTGNSPKWTPHPMPVVYRGFDGTHAENFGTFANDIAVAYGSALRWKISGDRVYARKAIEILNAYSSTMTGMGGDPNAELLQINSYQFANVGEIMRSDPEWSSEDFAKFQTMMKTVFYPPAHDFLTHHDGQGYSFMWASWDLLSMDAVYAIGVLCDDRSMTTEAIDYFYNGIGEGCINRMVYFIHPGYLGQTQESGRDQGHNTLEIALLAPLCEMAWHQGVDLYGYNNNRFLAGAEYVAKYNLLHDVPYVTYANETGFPTYSICTAISSDSRGGSRPGWDIIYNHYVNRKGLAAPYSAAFAAKIRPTKYGGQDQPGFDTLTASLDPIPTGANPSGLTVVVTAQQPVLSWWGSAYATSYNIKRATRGGAYSAIATGVKTNTYTDTTAAPGATYYYAVTATLSDDTTTGPSNEAKAIAGASLYAHVKFDETDGATAADSTGNGWSGTLVHSPQWWTGDFSNAVSLTGSSGQYVSLPAGVVSDLSDFTICAWVYLNSSTPLSRIFDFGSGTERYMYLTPDKDGVLRFAITGCGTHGEEGITSSAPLPARQWVHVAVTLNGLTGTLYVNGVAAGTNPEIAFTPSRLGSTTNNWIGRSEYTADPYLDGKVADFRIYRGALSSAELKSVMAANKSFISH